MANSKTIEEAAEKYAKEFWADCDLTAKRICFIRGAESDAAKEYWFEQFKANIVQSYEALQQTTGTSHENLRR